MIKLYNKNETDFTHNGIVVLEKSIKTEVLEELNGKYELYVEYLLEDKKADYILKHMILKVEGQLFRIFKIEKDTEKHLVQIWSRHIFYDLDRHFNEDYRVRNGNCSLALQRALQDTPFSGTSDINDLNNANYIEESPLESIFKKILPRWGGELIRDNFSIDIRGHKGQNKGILLTGGKNIKGIKERLDTSKMVTRIYPVGYNGLTLQEKYVVSQNFDEFPVTKKVEFKEATTEEGLRLAGQKYLEKYSVPILNYKVDMIDLSHTIEYKKYKIFSRVEVGDWLNFRYRKFGIENSVIQVIKIKKDLKSKSNIKIELGQPIPTITETINKNIQDTNSISDIFSNLFDKENKIKESFWQDVIDLATKTIKSNDGHVVLKDNGIYILDTNDLNTAKKVWKFGAGGLGYSTTGVNGKYETAITSDGMIVADFVATGRLKGGYVDFDLNAGTFLIGESKSNYLMYFDGERLKINGVDIDITNNKTISDINKTLGSKADSETVTQINNDLNKKIEKNSSDLQLTSKNFSVEIGKVVKAFDNKVASTNGNVDSNIKKITENKSNINQLADSVSSEVERIEGNIYTNYNKITNEYKSQIGQTADEINEKVSAVERNLNDTKHSLDSNVSEINNLKNENLILAERMLLAEQKTTKDSITSVVMSSEKYKSDNLVPITSKLSINREGPCLHPLTGKIVQANESIVINEYNSDEQLVYSADLNVIGGNITTFKRAKEVTNENKSKIEQLDDELNLNVTEIKNNLSDFSKRISSAEIKLTPNSIVNTVRKSKEYLQDQKIITDKFSEFEMTTDNIKLSVNDVSKDLETSIELVEGKIEAKGKAIFTSLKGYGTTIINGSNIMTDSIGARSICLSELIVGENIQLSPSATIHWNNVNNKPNLALKDDVITDYSELSNKPFIPSQYTDSAAVQAWRKSNYATHIDSKGVYTGTVMARQIYGSLIEGKNIKTSTSNSNYVHAKDQWIDVVHDGNRTLTLGSFKLSLSGSSTDFKFPVLAFGNIPKSGSGEELNSNSYNYGVIYRDEKYEKVLHIANQQGISIHSGNNSINVKQDKIKFHGTVDFTGATLEGLDNIKVVPVFG